MSTQSISLLDRTCLLSCELWNMGHREFLSQHALDDKIAAVFREFHELHSAVLAATPHTEEEREMLREVTIDVSRFESWVRSHLMRYSFSEPLGSVERELVETWKEYVRTFAQCLGSLSKRYSGDLKRVPFAAIREVLLEYYALLKRYVALERVLQESCSPEVCATLSAQLERSLSAVEAEVRLYAGGIDLYSELSSLQQNLDCRWRNCYHGGAIDRAKVAEANRTLEEHAEVVEVLHTLFPVNFHVHKWQVLIPPLQKGYQFLQNFS